MLGNAHTPDNRTGTVFGHGFGGLINIRFLGATDSFDFRRWPVRHFLTDLFHSINTLIDKAFIFPAIFKNVPQHTPDKRDIRTTADTNKLIRMGGGTTEARVDYNDRCTTFFTTENML